MVLHVIVHVAVTKVFPLARAVIHRLNFNYRLISRTTEHKAHHFLSSQMLFYIKAHMMTRVEKKEYIVDDTKL